MASSSALNSEKELRNPTVDDGSTSTQVPSTLGEGKEREKNEETETGNTSINKEDEVESIKDAIEYPKGASLAFIIIAIILSIFLASLDMVGEPSSTIFGED